VPHIVVSRTLENVAWKTTRVVRDLDDIRRIRRGRDAERAWRETGIAETIPAVAPDGGDVAMPLREAYEFYGTARGAVPNYVNAFAVQSFAYTTPFDAIGAGRLIEAPTLIVHSENALAPALARKFAAELRAPAETAWLASSGQIDFYDDPILIGQAADLIAAFFNRVLRVASVRGRTPCPLRRRSSRPASSAARESHATV
jgi:fermentation-respiration switch protein FrsA (DUF1100 family)